MRGSALKSTDAQPRANILVAFPYWKDKLPDNVIAGGDRIRLLVDSGAFTAWKAGKPIALDDYCRFLEKLPVTPWRYFTLDVIGDAAGSMRNYETMLKRGFKPVPIFTRGEDPTVLEDYYKTSDVVGIGGLVGTQDNKGFVNGIMKRAGKRRVHWLGFANVDYIKHYRPYMCDASTWENGGKFGAVRLYMGNGRNVSVLKSKMQTKPPEEIAHRIRELGFEPMLLRERANWHGGASVARRLGAASALAFSIDMQRAIGTYLFNASATAAAIQFFVDAFDHQAKRFAAMETA